MDPLACGWAAVARADWAAARESFAAAVEGDPTGDAMDGLATAHWWLGETEAAAALRPRAFRALRRSGRHAQAAMVAVMEAAEHRIAGNASAARGWMGQAERLVTAAGACPAAGWLEIERAKRADTPAAAAGHARTALKIARELDDEGLEACALSHLGRALVAAGRVEEGATTLDEAMAVTVGSSGGDPLGLSDACCTTLTACEDLSDVARGLDWARTTSAFLQDRRLLPLTPWCRAIYGAFLVRAGRWPEAEAELRAALADARRLRGLGGSLAVARLADLRLRQGRVEEARALLSGVEGEPFAIEPVVALRLAEGRHALAAEELERRLEAAAGRPAVAAPLTALLARVRLAAGDPAHGRRLTAAAGELALAAGREDLVAICAVLRAEAALGTGERADPAELERAIATLTRLELPLECHRARLLLARVEAPSRREIAVELARQAHAGLRALGALPDADRAAALLRELGAPPGPPARGDGPLSHREEEVLALLSEGLSNAEIAERLVISPKTAEHHVGRILRKLGARNRAEAAAYAVRLAAG